MTQELEVREMWRNGPLREFSTDEKQPGGSWIAQAGGGWAKRYVCKRCKRPCNGVYSPAWVCGPCRKSGVADVAIPRSPSPPPVTEVAANKF